MITIVKIKSFEPYMYDVPDRDVFVGSIKIMLPPVHVNVMDFGPLVPGAHIGGDIGNLAFDIEGIEEPGMTRDELIKFLNEGKDEFQKVWQLYQEKLKEHGPLLGSIFERGK